MGRGGEAKVASGPPHLLSLSGSQADLGRRPRQQSSASAGGSREQSVASVGGWNGARERTARLSGKVTIYSCKVGELDSTDVFSSQNKLISQGL